MLVYNSKSAGVLIFPQGIYSAIRISMRNLYSIVTLVLAVTVSCLAWEMFSSEKQCADAAFQLLSRGGLDGTNGTKRVEAACARLEANGTMAEKVLNKLP